MALAPSAPSVTLTARPSDRVGTWLFLVLLVCYFAYALTTITPEHPWGDDWAQYLLHARNLIQGHPYADIGYLFNPDFPNVGPPSYPPGLPLLLAAPLAAFGLNIFALKSVCFLVLVLGLLVAFRLFRAHIGPTQAAIAVILFALHPLCWSLTQWISSEAPYIALSLLTLWLASSKSLPLAPGVPALAAGVLIGLSLYGTVICRSIGVALLPALLLFGWSRRQPVHWFIGLIVTFSLLVLLQTRFFVTPPTYSNELRIPTPSLFVSNVISYTRELSALFPLPAGLSKFSGPAIVALAMLGAHSIRIVPALGTIGLRMAVSRVPIVTWYLCFYTLALLLVPIEPSARYILPILPIVIFMSVAKVSLLIPASDRRNWYILALIAAPSAYYVQLNLRPAEHDSSATCSECAQMFDFVRSNTAPSEVIVFSKPRAMALYTERRSWRASDHYTADQLKERLHAVGATVVVLGRSDSDFARKYPVNQALSQEIHEVGASVIFQNAMFQVVRLRRP